MQFHLNYTPEPLQTKMNHSDSFLMIGSCFSEHIGNNMQKLKFNIHSNPFGIVFNPLSIAFQLNRICNKNYFTENDVFEKDNNWYSFEAHSFVSAKSKNELIKKLNETIDDWHNSLKNTKCLFITLGSAFAYYHIEKQQIVSNCHKFPGNVFTKKLLQLSDILSVYKDLMDSIFSINPNIQIIYTVSPVKHLRDGVVENNLSKAILLQTVHQLISEYKNCSYFPAFELVNDDLRDYRFYEKDLAHPNNLAIEYVWNKFIDCCFDENTKQINLKIEQINKAFQHKIFNHNTQLVIDFKKDFYNKCQALKTQYPYLNFENELQYFSE